VPGGGGSRQGHELIKKEFRAMGGDERKLQEMNEL
jgi:hypothetical protein